MIVHVEQVMGTVFSFHVESGDCRPEDARAAVDSACTRLHDLDEIFSTWKPLSPMSLLRVGRLALGETPPEMSEVLDLCREAKELSQGWFDPWAMPGGLDPTGLVKGWAAEQALAVLERAGVAAAMVNGGGDIALLGLPGEAPTWRIGVRHPWRAEALACVLETDRAVATSGCYERAAPHQPPQRENALPHGLGDRGGSEPGHVRRPGDGARGRGRRGPGPRPLPPGL